MENYKLSNVDLASSAPGKLGLIFSAVSNDFFALAASPFLAKAIPK
jgi:hypothetical protein